MDTATRYHLAVQDADSVAQLYDDVYENNSRDPSLPHIAAQLDAARRRVFDLHSQMFRESK